MVLALHRLDCPGRPAFLRRGFRRVFRHRGFDRPGAALHGFPAQPDHAVFVVVQVAHSHLVVPRLSVQRVIQDHRRFGVSLLRILRPAGQADRDGPPGQQNALRNLAPLSAAVDLPAAGQFPHRFLLLDEVLAVHVNHVPHDHGDLRVKLRAGPGDDLLPDQLLRNRQPVAPVGRQGVVGIRHGNDPRDFRDLLPLQPFRIAGAVVPFMMVMRADPDIRIVLDAGKNLVAQHRVLLYDFIFFPRQLAFLVDNAV